MCSGDHRFSIRRRQIIIVFDSHPYIPMRQKVLSFYVQLNQIRFNKFLIESFDVQFCRSIRRLSSSYFILYFHNRNCSVTNKSVYVAPGHTLYWLLPRRTILSLVCGVSLRLSKWNFIWFEYIWHDRIY